MSVSIIHLKQLSHSFRAHSVKKTTDWALRDVSLTVEAGDIVGIIGESGAGKSTLLRTINDLITPSQGEVWVDGQRLSDLTAREKRALRRRMGMIFQHFNLIDNQTVAQNIALPLKLMGQSQAEQEAHVATCLTDVGLSPSMGDRYPSALSGGQKQRVAIARALACSPKILLCDEATSALDPSATQDILNLLATLNQKQGLTIVLITHEMAVAKAICHRVLVMSDGQVVEQGDTLKIFTRPQHAFTQKLVAHVTHLQLPQPLADQKTALPTSDNDSILIQLTYIDDSTTTPLLSQLTQTHHVTFNILQARIETLRQHLVGFMLVALAGPDKAHCQRALDALNAQSTLHTQVLGYVPHHTTRHI